MLFLALCQQKVKKELKRSTAEWIGVMWVTEAQMYLININDQSVVGLNPVFRVIEIS